MGNSIGVFIATSLLSFALIAGLGVVTPYIGNEMLDASVKAKFEGLKKQLKSIQI